VTNEPHFHTNSDTQQTRYIKINTGKIFQLCMTTTVTVSTITKRWPDFTHTFPEHAEIKITPASRFFLSFRKY